MSGVHRVTGRGRTDGFLPFIVRIDTGKSSRRQFPVWQIYRREREMRRKKDRKKRKHGKFGLAGIALATAVPVLLYRKRNQ